MPWRSLIDWFAGTAPRWAVMDWGSNRLMTRSWSFQDDERTLNPLGRWEILPGGDQPWNWRSLNSSTIPPSDWGLLLLPGVATTPFRVHGRVRVLGNQCTAAIDHGIISGELVGGRRVRSCSFTRHHHHVGENELARTKMPRCAGDAIEALGRGDTTGATCGKTIKNEVVWEWQTSACS